MNISEFSKECLDALELNLEIVRNKTNTVAQFMDEFEDEFTWDRIPFTYLFQLFGVWYTDTHFQKPQYGLNAFIDDVALWVAKSEKFELHPKSFRPSIFMSVPEPLTKQYELGYPWVSESSLQGNYSRGERPLTDCVPPYSSKTYKEGGLYRKGIKGTTTYKGPEWDESEENHPAEKQYAVTEFKDGKVKRHKVDPIVIVKKYFLVNESEESIVLSPVNMADAQGGGWPLKIDKKLFHVEYTKAELWLMPLTKQIYDDYKPIQEAIARITACNREEGTDKWQDE